MKRTSTPSEITSGQEKKLRRLAEDATNQGVSLALEKVIASQEGWQKVIENGNELHQAIVEAIMSKVRELSATDRYADEEVKSNYEYPKGYKVKGITEQVATLGEFFPELKDATYNMSIATQPLPYGAEGWFAIPRWEKIGLSYGESVEKVLAMIASKRKFYNYRDGQLGAKYLRQHAKTAKMFQKLGDEQKDHDILVVPAQFGFRHKGRSTRRAREVFQANEFGLGAFAVGIMLLTHPEREVQWKQLHIDCAGDEYSYGADGVFGGAPIFFFDDKVGFDAYEVDNADGSYGSASGFRAAPLPQ